MFDSLLPVAVWLVCAVINYFVFKMDIGDCRRPGEWTNADRAINITLSLICGVVGVLLILTVCCGHLLRRWLIKVFEWEYWGKPAKW